MKLYHASKHKFDVLKRNQVEVPDDVIVPESELQNKIYLTPSLGFALAMAAGPSGMTFVEDGKISFENAADFNPEKVVYLYEVDSDSVANELIEKVDDEQVVVDLDELQPDTVQTFKAAQVFDYYELVDWKQLNN